MSNNHIPVYIGVAFNNDNKPPQRAVIIDGDSVACLLPDETIGCTYNAQRAEVIRQALDIWMQTGMTPKQLEERIELMEGKFCRIAAIANRSWD